MAWACTAANGADTLTFIHNFTTDVSNRMNVNVERGDSEMWSQSSFIIQQDNDCKQPLGKGME